MLVLFGLVGASLVPLATLATRLGRWSRSAAFVRDLQRCSEAASLGGIPHRVLPLDSPAFFTAGLWRPQIYVSSGAVDQLSPKALAAGLLHEHAHLKRHDVAWRAAMGVLEAAFRPLPWVRRTISSLVLESEVAADRFALDAGARPADLFDAVVAASGNLPAAAHVGLASAGTMERLNLLLEPAAEPPPAVPVTERGGASPVVPPTTPGTTTRSGLLCSSRHRGSRRQRSRELPAGPGSVVRPPRRQAACGRRTGDPALRTRRHPVIRTQELRSTRCSSTTRGRFSNGRGRIDAIARQ